MSGILQPRISKVVPGTLITIDNGNKSQMFRKTISGHRTNVEITNEKDLKDIYPEIINFYTSVPSYSISIHEFQHYAMERLRMLRLLELIKSESATYNSNEHYNAILRAINKHQDDIQTYHTLFFPRPSEADGLSLVARKIDHISHFLLRLTFARTDEQRKWFLSMEVDLFRLKLYKLANINTIIEKFGLPYSLINEKEKDQLRREISNASFLLGPPSALDCPIYKTEFIHALEPIRRRKIFLCKGYAYIPLSDLPGIISQKFRCYLSESLAILSKNMHVVENDERVRRLVCEIEQRHLADNAVIISSRNEVSLSELAIFSEKSFPLCMKHLYDVVLKTHHLKHWGRLQLGLFFKGLGLHMTEAIKFWRTNFMKHGDIDAIRFDKQYIYNIRHMYGQEGNRFDYIPYSCTKVLNSSVGSGDHHGCPFKHSDQNFLRYKFHEAGIPHDGMKDILKFVNEKKYQLACLCYFEWTHNKISIANGVNHPNQYFIESRNALAKGKEIETKADEIEIAETSTYKNDGLQRHNINLKERPEFENFENEMIRGEPDEILAAMEIEKY